MLPSELARRALYPKTIHYHVWEVLPHAPHSPDMSPPDFDSFPKLKELMCGRRFSYLEELFTDVAQAILHMNISDVLNEILMLPKHWDSIIEKQ